ncbi:unnamed protein product [Clonostachys solani]|uniref:Uncharacterized protein n=1 Tax=Clonostachys solani TaxID=160281 RepID=A0A9N9ZFZ7_9HYPO|nr:unnamed protein product [Clonostachys solani]
MGLLCNLIPPTGIKITDTPVLLVFSWDDESLFTYHEDRVAILWDVSRVAPAQRLELGPGTLIAAAFTSTPIKHLVLTYGPDHPTQQFRIVDACAVPYTPQSFLYPNATIVKSSPDGTMLAFATAHTVEVRAVGSGQHIRTIDLLREAVSLEFSRDSTYLAMADTQGKLTIVELFGDEVLQSTLGKIISDYTTSIRPCRFDTEPGWIPVDIVWHSKRFGIYVTSQKEFSPGEPSYRLMWWFPRSEKLDMPLTPDPSGSVRYKDARLAPSHGFFACVTTDHDLVLRDINLTMGYSVGLKGRATACSVSTSSSRVAFSCSNGRLGVWHVGQPQFGCQGG